MGATPEVDAGKSSEMLPPEALTHFGVIKSALGALRDPDERDLTAHMASVLYWAWRQLQVLHPDLRNVALKLGSGKELRRGKEGIGGHFAANAWKSGEQLYAEVMISGEVLGCGSVAVLTILLHEAVHAIAWVRRERMKEAGAEPKDIKKLEETSDRGRYHNGLFRSIGDELGLEGYRIGRFGWWGTELRESAKEVYAPILSYLDANLDLSLAPPTKDQEDVEDEDDIEDEDNVEDEDDRKDEDEGDREGDQEEEQVGEVVEPGDREVEMRDANLPACGCPCGFHGRISIKQLTTRFPLCGRCGERIVPRDAELLAMYEPALVTFLSSRSGRELTIVGSEGAGEAAADPGGTGKVTRATETAPFPKPGD